MRQKIKIDGLTDTQNEQLNKQLDARSKNEEDERKKAIEGRVPFVLSSVPRPRELAEGVFVAGRDGTTFNIYVKCSDGVMRHVTITP